MSEPDNRAIAREMAENRDANLVSAANRGVDCREQLDAAKRRVSELEISNRDAGRLINEVNWQLADSERAKEAAERKLADLVEKILKSNASPWNPDAVVTALLDLKTEAKALAQIEPPQSSHPTVSLLDLKGIAPDCTGSMNSVEFVDSLREQPQSTPAELPKAANLTGSDPEFTGEMSTDEYVARMRGRQSTPVEEANARLVHNSDVHGPRGLTPRSLAGFFRNLSHRRELYDIVPEGSHNVLTTAIVDDQRQRVVMTYTATKEAGEHV